MIAVDARNGIENLGVQPAAGYQRIGVIGVNWYSADTGIAYDVIETDATRFPQDQLVIANGEFKEYIDPQQPQLGTVQLDPRRIEYELAMKHFRDFNILPDGSGYRNPHGYYRHIPMRDYLDPINHRRVLDMTGEADPGFERDYFEWKAKTREHFGRLNQRVNILFPGLYTPYPEEVDSYPGWGWPVYAEENLAVADWCGVNGLKAPFIWVKYQSGDPPTVGQYAPMPINEFEDQLRWCFDNTDGVIVWDNYLLYDSNLDPSGPGSLPEEDRDNWNRTVFNDTTAAMERVIAEYA